MKQQTAVEWLWRWQMDNEFVSFEEGVLAYKQAKTMEKEQIENAFNYGNHNKWGSESQINNGEDYYNETFKK